jgi:hypothetical protein
MTMVQPLMIMRICIGFKLFHPCFLRVMMVQKSFQVKMAEKNQIEIVSVAKAPVLIHNLL